ncbi:GNAT family N-acetyltransferase [Streptosporangium sp. NPDC002544]|uniref:GNAT family N-acetyltransferase n=1 Tax=Streptosporangium sp. NPDC002544 TaxID=3154538 RepID=UPI00332A1034
MSAQPLEQELRFPIPETRMWREAGSVDTGEGLMVDLRVHRQSPFEQPAEWLEAVRRFRAWVLYDNGSRPSFRVADTDYVDAQSLDLGSYHLIAYLEGGTEIVGCARLAPPGLAPRFQTRCHLGDREYADMLANMQVPAASVFEAGRLATAPELQGQGLGSWMVNAVVAAGHALGASLLLSTSGTGQGQHLLFGRLGWQAFPDTDKFSAHYQDTVRVIAHRLSLGLTAAELRRHMDNLSAEGTAHIQGMRL